MGQLHEEEGEVEVEQLNEEEGQRSDRGQIWVSVWQGGTICGAIEESSRSLKSIDKHVFINFCDKYAVFTNFRDKNAVFTRFQDKNDVFEVYDKNTVFGFNFVCSG